MPIVVRHNPAKWARNAANSQSDYTAGVQSPKVQWDVATAAAAPLYEAGVQKAIQNKSFAKGVKAAGHSGWQDATLAKGPARFAEGVRTAQGAYDQGVAPYIQTLQSLNLTPRGPKGSPGNYQRSQQVGMALNAAKAKIQGS